MLFVPSLIVLLITGVNALESTAYLYTRGNQGAPTIIEDGSEFNKTKPLKILIHGWLESIYDSAYSDLVREYLKKEDCNVIIFEWIRNHGDFCKTINTTKLVGNHLGDFLSLHFKSFGHIHLIGYGLGAHLAGFAGKYIQTFSNGSKVGRISGLDPTLPRFNNTPAEERLDKTDADIVDVYHCDSYRLTIGDPIGTVDFYIEEGKAPLPGCTDSNPTVLEIMYKNLEDALCSTYLCRKHFLHSINDDRLLATECDSWEKYKKGQCDKNEKVFFGENVEANSKGIYFINCTYCSKK